MNFLDKVLATKQKEVAALKKRFSTDKIKKQCESDKNRRAYDPRSLRQSLLTGKPFGLIAEIKLASPSRGRLTNVSCAEIARQYARSAADAISVLTDKTYFEGDIDYLQIVRDIAPQPIFRKDFIIDPYQIYQTAMSGGDAFLLMATLLDSTTLEKFVVLGKELGLESVVEVHTEEDVRKTICAGATIVGINNRDLATMSIDISTTERLKPLIPRGTIVISESGIVTLKDVRRVLAAGVDGILVGTSIVESNDYVKKIADLKTL